MKKLIWSITLVLGLGLTLFGVLAVRVQASEVEMYLDVMTDTFDESYSRNFEGGFGRPRKAPLLFIGVGEDIKDDILLQASLLNIDPSLYVLALSLSTYDTTYTFQTIVDTLKTLEGESLVTYIDSLNVAMASHSEAIKDTLETLKETFMPQIQDIRQAYKGEVRQLIRAIRNASDENKDALLLELEALKIDIKAEISVVQLLYLEALSDENIAIEGLYGLFVENTRGRMEPLRQFEQRFPRLFDRIKGHMRG